MTAILAGAARKTISPPLGIYLMGYGNRIQGNTGIHDDLYVTTLVLQTSRRQAALITVDHTFINAAVVNLIKDQVQETCGIDPDGVLVCCSHTHGGPIGYANERSRREDREYVDFLVRTLTASVIEAVSTLQPAHLVGGTSQAFININRRERTPEGTIIIGNNPEGPVDTSVQVVQVVSDQDTPIATLVNYACHPVVMGPRNRQATADWVGIMRREVEAAQGGLCLFFQGATGDVNPRKMRWTADNWDEVEEQGAAVAAAVQQACDRTTPLNTGEIQTQQAACWLRLIAPRGYGEAIRAFMPPGVETDEDIRSTIRQQFPWHTEIDARPDGVYSPVYVGALRLGDWALATLATEPFTEIGLAIKAASPAKMTFVAGYTNGCNSYLPVQSAYEEGGYEVETAALFYGLPAGFAPGGAETVTRAIISLL
jgi:neutral ceramidase